MNLHDAAKLPLLELGRLANAAREQAHGNRVYFAAQPASGTVLECRVHQMVEALLQASPTLAIEPHIVADAGDTTGEAEIRFIALARLAYPGPIHVRAHFADLTDAIAQVALRFGADELTGFPAHLDHREITRTILEAGRQPYPCDAAYSPVLIPNAKPTLQVLEP